MYKKNIEKFCSTHKLINDKQFGFKYEHSTVNAIHLLTSTIMWNWNKKFCTGACLIDLEKAFDTIWIPGLIYKLKTFKFPINQIILIYNMITNKSFKIHHENVISKNSFQISNGLQQGTVNSPVLFNLYILDLLDKIDNIIAFADDIVIYHSDKKIEEINGNLQSKFDLVEKYTLDWHLSINTQKCEIILFRPPVEKCNHNVRTKWKNFSIK